MKLDLELVMRLAEVVGLVAAAMFVVLGHVNTPGTLALFGLLGAIYARLWINTYGNDG